MFIRNFARADRMIGNKPYLNRTKTALYPTAFPFDRAPVPSVVPVVIHGSAPTVTSQVDLWAQNIVRTLPTVAFTFAVSSSSATDAPAQTGALTVEVDWLDANFVPSTTAITLNGQTKVTGLANCLRINDVRVTTSGSGKTNAGDIYVYDNSDTVVSGVPQTSSKIFQKISAGDTVARGGFYTVPAGCQLQTQQFRGGFDDVSVASRSGNFTISYSIATTNGLQGTFPISGQVSNTQGFISVQPDFPLLFDEKVDLIIKCTASASSIMAAYIDAVLFFK